MRVNPTGWVNPDGLEFVKLGRLGHDTITIDSRRVEWYVVDLLDLSIFRDTVAYECNSVPNKNADIEFSLRVEFCIKS